MSIRYGSDDRTKTYYLNKHKYRISACKHVINRNNIKIKGRDFYILSFKQTLVSPNESFRTLKSPEEWLDEIGITEDET